MKRHLLWPAIALALVGCQTQPAIVVVTSTTLGFKLGQNPTTQMYSGELGYVRLETAYVPLTNTVDVPDVVTEMKFNGLFNGGGGFYQRLAVGKIACSQSASTVMFSRDSHGMLDPAFGRMVIETQSRTNK